MISNDSGSPNDVRSRHKTYLGAIDNDMTIQMRQMYSTEEVHRTHILSDHLRLAPNFTL